ncbi:MAG: 2'-5' RNA ligase family protein [Gelidibacter sp.]|uniref:2'-5' RNA ligase family protein n=1 Tax=Gelidibacter sp. TaxID=2018083 RepID=UPI003267B544
MNLQDHYNQLYKDSITKITSDHYEIDPLINSDQDDRFGLSLIIRPSVAIKNEIQKFLNELNSIEPNQYYYPNSDIHITVISVISCYSGLQLSQIKVPAYIKLIANSLKNQEAMTLSLKGITASASCIMIQGFTNDDSLNQLRDRLRKEFINSDLEQSMDERYLIQTAHATVFRFKEKLAQKEKFLEIIEKYRAYDFGTFSVDGIELVYNNWYHQERFVTKLHHFKINKIPEIG